MFGMGKGHMDPHRQKALDMMKQRFAAQLAGVPNIPPEIMAKMGMMRQPGAGAMSDGETQSMHATMPPPPPSMVPGMPPAPPGGMPPQAGMGAGAMSDGETQAAAGAMPPQAAQGIAQALAARMGALQGGAMGAPGAPGAPGGPANLLPATGGFNQALANAVPHMSGDVTAKPVGVAMNRPAGTVMHGARPY